MDSNGRHTDDVVRSFLAAVEERVPARYRGVDFAAIIKELVAWSTQPRRRLRLREPGDQAIVSFAPADTDVVLWSAFPRYEDGAKVEVMSRLFRRGLSDDEREVLMRDLAVVAPKVRIVGTGNLMLPMHLLATERAMLAFLTLLDHALSFLRPGAAGAATRR